MGWTSIPVRDETREQLSEMKDTDETWDELVRSMIEDGRVPEYVVLEPSEHRKIAEQVAEVIRNGTH